MTDEPTVIDLSTIQAAKDMLRRNALSDNTDAYAAYDRMTHWTPPAVTVSTNTGIPEYSAQFPCPLCQTEIAARWIGGSGVMTCPGCGQAYTAAISAGLRR